MSSRFGAGYTGGRGTGFSGFLLLGWVFLCSSAGAGTDVSYWAQAATQLTEFGGAPLLSANWEGPYRPYVFRDGRFVALAELLPRLYATWDFYRPTALSSTEILLGGTDAGRRTYDLLKYDLRTQTLVNLTATPTIDEGNPCFEPQGRTLVFRRGTAERFARLDGELKALRHEAVPAFRECIFADDETVLGVARDRSGYALYRCRLTGDSVKCVRRKALEAIEDFSGFIRHANGALGVAARRKGEEFRRPFALAAGFDELHEIPVPDSIDGDVLDYDGSAFRFGFQSRYRSSLAPSFDGVVYSMEKIGHDYFGIVATPRHPRTLARLVGESWRPILHPSVKAPEEIPAPREVWLRSPAGERYQAFQFGREEQKRYVLWWHGGPHENVSPRFNPYFQKLNEMGFAVLAVNYPGSTGRGARYERSFEEEALVDCLRAVWRHLEDRDATTVVSWSVSAGVALQTLLLRHEFPVSALVDQVGVGRTGLVAASTRRGIPLFVIRGRHDPSGPTVRVDYHYDGGHDITRVEDFVGLFDRVGPFLGTLQPATRAPAAAMPSSRHAN